MTRIGSSVLTALVLAAFVAAPSRAQDDDTPPGAGAGQAPAPSEAPAEDPPGDTDADESASGESDGTPADAAGPELGEPAVPTGDPAQADLVEIVRDTFDDWQVRCAPDGADCFMYQLARDAEDNPVAEVSLLKLDAADGSAAGVTIVTPLGTLLPAGVVLQIDTGEERQYPFAWCSQVGCFSRFAVDDATVTAMKRGRVVELTLVSVNAPESPLALDVSLTGFTAAFDSLEALPAN